MRVSSRNIAYHELIGLEVRILQYPDPSLVGLKGKVVDETLKTLVIETLSGRRVRIFKFNSILEFVLPDGEAVVIKGSTIIGRPWDRLKMVSR